MRVISLWAGRWAICTPTAVVGEASARQHDEQRRLDRQERQG